MTDPASGLLNHTHDAGRRSWLASANADGGDFPIQNLPFAVFRRVDSDEAFRGGVAIGDQIVDLAALGAAGVLTGAAASATAACRQPALNDFFALGPPAWQALRHGLFALLAHDAPLAVASAVERCLVPQAAVDYRVPARIGDYTDFYTSFHHAQNIGRLFSAANDVVPLNFHHIPIAYHGRASSVVISGSAVRRPLGQSKPPDASTPTFGPCRWLDYELELGVFVGTGNALGSPVLLRAAERHLFGICLLNDWSARDIQGWEMQPLGPFLSKNFATTISPWIVTMEALAPYRVAWQRESRFPQPLPYLDDAFNREHGAFDIRLEVGLETAARKAAGVGPARLTQTSFRHQHWTVAQMLAHHTVGGCNLQSGDLFGSGTISGPTPPEAGAMMELSQAGRQPVRFDDGEGGIAERAFLQDGDAVVFTGWCERPGFARIGFGACRGTVLPSVELAR